MKSIYGAPTTEVDFTNQIIPALRYLHDDRSTDIMNNIIVLIRY